MRVAAFDVRNREGNCRRKIVRCVRCNFDNPPQARFCESCGLNLYETERGNTQQIRKSPTAAVLLSFFLPAGGQFYNGDIKKALAIGGGYILGIILAYFVVGGFVVLGVWIWSMIDAYNVASGKQKVW
jgi:TM2 domain-containing membrane protein YozV